MNDNLRKGSITELLCITHCIQNNIMVSKPVCNARYDIIIDTGKKLLRVQIKTSRQGRYPNTIVFSCKSVHKTASSNKIMQYTEDEIDYFMTVWEGKFYLIPCTGSGQKTLFIGEEKEKTPNQHHSTLASDYEFYKVISQL